MPSVTFIPDPLHRFVNWNDPARWSTGVVPNDPTVDVVVPTTTVVASGEIYSSFISQAGAYTISSLAITSNFLTIDGSLSVIHDVNIYPGNRNPSGAVSLSPGASLVVGGSLDNNGNFERAGSVNVSGTFRNETLVVGSGLSLTASSFVNSGELHAASGDLTVTVSPGGFTNLIGSSLVGGIYSAGFRFNTSANGLFLNIGGVIATDAAEIRLDAGGMIYSYDDTSHSYVPVTSSLHLISNAGILSISSGTLNWSDLTVDGALKLSGPFQSPTTLNSTHLTVDSAGIVTGVGAVIGGPVFNEGKIIAGLPRADFLQLPENTSPVLLIAGPVSGSGTLEIAPTLLNTGSPPFRPFTLELGAAVSTKVVFASSRGILILDDPSSFSGQIVPAGSDDQIILRGISLGSVTGYDYSGSSDGGTLTIRTASGDTHLSLLGSFVTANFTLSAGPQNLSIDPPSLRITNTGSVALTGTSGDDSFTAPAGNWHFDAGTGIDTITFGFKLTDVTVTYSGNLVIIDGPSSHTVLNGFETFVFTDGTVNNNDGNWLVDDLFYYSRYHDVWNAHVDADAHYNSSGWHEYRNPNAFFDTGLYLSLYQDVKASGVNPLTQFDTSGWMNHRIPSFNFNPDKYLKDNPDIAAAHVDPLEHFLHNGAQEGRQPPPVTELIAANGFDYVYYLQHNPDVLAAHVDPFEHFQTHGWLEGRNPNALFDTRGYLAQYRDVAAAHVNPLDHYHLSGWTEGRDPSIGFDTTSYLAAYPDVAAAHIDPLKHFLQDGIHEGRSPFADGVWG